MRCVGDQPVRRPKLSHIHTHELRVGNKGAAAAQEPGMP